VIAVVLVIAAIAKTMSLPLTNRSRRLLRLLRWLRLPGRRRGLRRLLGLLRLTASSPWRSSLTPRGTSAATSSVASRRTTSPAAGTTSTPTTAGATALPGDELRSISLDGVDDGCLGVQPESEERDNEGDLHLETALLCGR
jgi:hypothetical protein